jgi:hypothetical protein
MLPGTGSGVLDSTALRALICSPSTTASKAASRTGHKMTLECPADSAIEFRHGSNSNSFESTESGGTLVERKEENCVQDTRAAAFALVDGNESDDGSEISVGKEREVPCEHYTGGCATSFCWACFEGKQRAGWATRTFTAPAALLRPTTFEETIDLLVLVRSGSVPDFGALQRRASAIHPLRTNSNRDSESEAFKRKVSFSLEVEWRDTYSKEEYNRGLVSGDEESLNEGSPVEVPVKPPSPRLPSPDLSKGNVPNLRNYW